MKRWVLMGCRVAVALGLLWWVLSRPGNLSAVRDLLAAKWLLPLMMVQAMVGGAIESMRLGVLYRSQNLHVPLGYGFQLVSVAAFFSLCIPGGTGGDVMKLYYLSSKNPGKGVEIATVLLVDRVVAVFVLLSLLVTLALAEGHLISRHPVILILVSIGAVAMAGILVSAALVCSRRIRASRLYSFIARRALFGNYLIRIGDALLSFRNHKAVVVKAAALSLIGHSLLAGMFAAAGTVVLPQTPSAAVCVLSLLGMFANALPLTPGGVGVGESAFQSLFSIAGFSGGAALMLSWRLGMISLCAIGCVFYIAGLRGRTDNLPQPISTTNPASL